jgi:hypothetical protein
MDLYITQSGLTYSFLNYEEEHENEKRNKENGPWEIEERERAEYHRADVDLKGASIKKENIVKEFPSAADYNFFYSHCPAGVYGVKEYEKITIKNVYPGIDWVLYNSDQKGFKYDFIVHPGADPSQIRLVYKGAKLKTKNGNLEISTPLGTITDNSPVTYIDKVFKTVTSSFKLSGNNEISFAIDTYDNSQTLVIDPQIKWYTRGQISGFGGILDVDVNQANGDFAATGYYQGAGFPFFNPGGGAYFQTKGQIIIMLFNSKGVLKWSTLYGSTTSGLNDYGYSILFDANNNIYVTGSGASAGNGFPLYDPLTGAFFLSNASASSNTNTIILKFDPNGVRLWATNFGEFGIGNDIRIDQFGNIFVGGAIFGNALPTLNPAGGAYFSGTSIAGSNNAFISKFSSAGVLLWSTYFGGSNSDVAGIAFDNTGNVYCTGRTGSGLPVMTAGGYFNNTYSGTSDAYVAEFTNNGILKWSTYFGGAGIDQGYAIQCDKQDNIIITGVTASVAGFPLQNPGGGAYYQAANAGAEDIFISKFTPATNLFWSTYYGGAGSDKGVLSYYIVGDVLTDNCDNIYVVGGTATPSSFPTYNPGCGSFYYTSGGQVILRFSPTGVRSWATLYGESTSSIGFRGTTCCAYDKNSRNFYTGGEIYGPGGTTPPGVDPGGGAYFDNDFAQPGDDSFLAKFSPDTLVLSKAFSPPSACTCNGSATVNIINCGMPPYNYKWSNGTQTLNTLTTSNTANGLCTGTYWVEVTDAACNRDTVFYTLPGGLTLNGTQNNVTCATSCNGSSTITPTGGSSPYIYSWSNGQTTQTATGLCPGSYSVIVTDAGNCTSVLNITINTFSISTTQTNILCSGNTTGNARVSATGNNGILTYSWQPGGQTTQSVSGLAAGIYTVVVTDANGCSLSQKVYIDEPEPILVTPTSQNISCTTSGSASVSVNGGITPYTYTWSSGQSGTSISCPAAGTYIATITDANGCVTVQSFNITGTSPVSATFTYPTICIGANTTFTNTGSTGTYSWVINAPANVSGTTNNFSYTFLTGGTYTITHTVASGGCTNTQKADLYVINCSAPTVTASANSICSGSCATVTSNPSGGSSPYTYSWSTGATSQNITQCPASTTTYTVKITDGVGATVTTAATVIVNPAVSVTTTAILNCGPSSGTITASVTGGSSSFTYSWSNGVSSITSSLTSNISNLPSNTYSVTVTDSKGCSAASSAIIDPPFGAQYIKGTANCVGCGCMEWIMINPFNGRAPYTYTWPGGYDKRYLNKLCPGNYTINVTDKNGCTINVVVNAP